ncbi:hypothetical protein MMC28_010421 [Mycoblastus sanguinarius]|nr:hypothetical protein [Mycoblastus sanguinarius]
MPSTATPPPSTKRKAKDLDRPSKKVRSSSTPTTRYTISELSALPHEDLLAYAIILQKQVDTQSASSPTASLSPAEVSTKVSNLQKLMVRQIKKAMTWKPSCKTGSAMFSQDFMVQSPQVVQALFKSVTDKPFKAKKLSPEDFEKVIGDEVQGSVRYATLHLASDVNCRWDEGSGMLKCSGKYGKHGTGCMAGEE